MAADAGLLFESCARLGCASGLLGFVGARLSLHQDKDEKDFSAPLVSVSLGVPAVFQLDGPHRADRPMRVPVQHGDVIVWGGGARLLYHGVMPLKAGHHSILDGHRVNLISQGRLAVSDSLTCAGRREVVPAAPTTAVWKRYCIAY
jgi:hypothetical protein